jgi:dsDNA-binding SOS-regulon protein
LRRLLLTPTVVCTLLIGSVAGVAHFAVFAQQPTPANNKPAAKPEKADKADKSQKTFTAEQIAELSIYLSGGREMLAKIRRNGVESGRICKPTCDAGKAEEATYQRRFVRGESMDKDKIRLDQKMPTLEYSLIFGSGQLWGIINGSSFTPRQDATSTFLAQHRHSLDNLLRYKENGSTLSLVGKDKQKGVDLYILDVIDKDKQSTRYYISRKTLHVLWLEYEEQPAGAPLPLKYSRKFMDYRFAQGTLVPYRTVLLEDGKQIQESRILNVTYGIRLDDALFKSPEA